MASVELAGVGKLYGTTRAVDDVSLKIPTAAIAACSDRRAAARPAPCA